MNLNKKQKMILCLSIVIIALMLLFPPFYHKIYRGSEFVGYHCLFTGPQTGSLFWTNREPIANARIDKDRLFLQFLIVIVLSGGALYLLKTKPLSQE